MERFIAHALTCFTSTSPVIPRNVSALALLGIHVLWSPQPSTGCPSRRSFEATHPQARAATRNALNQIVPEPNKTLAAAAGRVTDASRAPAVDRTPPPCHGSAPVLEVRFRGRFGESHVAT